MTNQEHMPATNNSSSEWPYHSDTHDLILKEMAAHGREVPPSYHEQQQAAQQAAAERQARAVAHASATHDISTLQLLAARARDSRETLEQQLERATSDEAIALGALAHLRSREATVAE